MVLESRRDVRIHSGDDVVTEPLAEIIDPDNFTPRLVSILSNVLVTRESATLRRLFDLGTNEWRVLSVLATTPGASSAEVAEFLLVDAALVSRSAGILCRRGLISLSDGPRGSRPMHLTRDGARMHDDMLPTALRGQEIVLEDFSTEEIDALNGFLRRMLAKAPVLQADQRARRAAGPDHPKKRLHK